MPASLDSIDWTARAIFAGCAVGLIGIIMLLIRRDALKEKYAVLWLPTGFAFLITSVFPEILLTFAAWAHLHYITVVVLGMIVVFTTMLLYFTVRLSKLREEVKTLAQEIALMKADAAELIKAKNQPDQTPEPATPRSWKHEGWTPAPPLPKQNQVNDPSHQN